MAIFGMNKMNNDVNETKISSNGITGREMI